VKRGAFSPATDAALQGPRYIEIRAAQRVRHRCSHLPATKTRKTRNEWLLTDFVIRGYTEGEIALAESLVPSPDTTTFCVIGEQRC